jgi:hypothetical protein
MALGIIALAMLLGVMIVVTARSFVKGSGSTRPAAPQAATERGRNYVRLQDKDGAQWTYLVRPGSPTDSQGLMRAPGRVTLDVVERTHQSIVGVALRARADGSDLVDIQKNGRSVEAQVRLLDDRGREVHAAQGSLGKFGFG